MIRVTIWNEYRHEKEMPEVAAIYPEGIHNELKKALSKENDDFVIRAVAMDDPECGLPDSVLEDTDVLIWWGHAHHGNVPDALAEKIADRVRKGMGFIALHSSHLSKPFLKLMGTSGRLNWRDGDRERLWTVAPGHPIAKGVPAYIEIPAEEMYGEPFGIPEPNRLVFIGWFAGGEVFRSGCCFLREAGRIFYFQPGHETNPTYKIPEIIKIIGNAVRWAYNPSADYSTDCTDCGHPAPLEK